MSTSVAPVLALLLILGVPLESPLSVDAPDGITVLKGSWQKITLRPGWDEPRDPASNLGLENTLENTRSSLPQDPYVNTTGTTMPMPTSGRAAERREQRKNTRSAKTESADPATGPARRVQQYLYQIKVLNSSDKAIEAIDWEYSVGESDSSGPRFHTFRRIKSASSSTLTGRSSVPPTRVVSARSGQAVLPSRVVIRCILYSDGTVTWRNTAGERECDAIRSQAKRR